MSVVVDIIKQVLPAQNRVLVSGVVATVVAVLMTSAIFFLLGGRLADGLPDAGAMPQSRVLVAGLVWAVAWSGTFLLTWIETRPRLGAADALEAKVIGVWAVRYSTPTFEPSTRKWLTDERDQTCIITRDDAGRLAMRFPIGPSDLLEGYDLVITHVSVRPSGRGGDLVYFGTHETRLSGPVARELRIAQENVSFRELGVLSFETRNGAVEEMAGRWSEVDGTLLRWLRRLRKARGSDIANDEAELELGMCGELRLRRAA